MNQQEIIDQIDAHVNYNVRQYVWDQILNRIRIQFIDKIYEQVNTQIREEVKYQVRTKVRNKIMEQVWNSSHL